MNVANAHYTARMTEDELLLGLCEALTLFHWQWYHARRSDHALTMGTLGMPDLFAVHPVTGMALVWELKSEDGHVTTDQRKWLSALDRHCTFDGRFDSRVVRPSDYDDALADIEAWSNGNGYRKLG